MRKKLGIDLDSTLNNLDKVWLKRYNEDYNDSLKQWNDWQVLRCVKPECGKKILDYLLEPNFFKTLGVQKYAAETIKYLSQYFDIYIITAYNVVTCVDKAEWLKEHFQMIKQENIIFCNDKSVLNIDYLIDDGPHNIEGFKQTGIIFDKPYNKHLNKKEYPYRCKTWKDVKLLFDKEFIIKKGTPKQTKILLNQESKFQMVLR